MIFILWLAGIGLTLRGLTDLTRQPMDIGRMPVLLKAEWMRYSE